MISIPLFYFESGFGFFTHFDVPPQAPKLQGRPSIRFGDVYATMDCLEYGAGFLLFIDNGVLTMLEGFTYDEPWPETVGVFKLEYSGGKHRDVDALCRLFE